jgi:excisionase family DNA binding protein
MTDTATETTWPEFMTVPEVALILRVSKMTVYRLVRSEELESIKVGRSYRVRTSSLRKITDGQQED